MPCNLRQAYLINRKIHTLVGGLKVIKMKSISEGFIPLKEDCLTPCNDVNSTLESAYTIILCCLERNRIFLATACVVLKGMKSAEVPILKDKAVYLFYVCERRSNMHIFRYIHGIWPSSGIDNKPRQFCTILGARFL